MAWIQEAKSRIVTVLEALPTQGLQVIPYVPESVVPPMAYLQAGSPWLDSEGVTFGELRLNYDVQFAVEAATNESETDDLEELISLAITALVNAGFGVSDTIDQPAMLKTGGATYLSAYLTVSVGATYTKEV